MRELDINNIENQDIFEVGYFDTYPENDNAAFNGVWNVYPFFGSGNIVLSDIEKGLFVIRKELLVNNFMGKSYYTKLYFFIVFTFLFCCESDDSITTNQIVSVREISTLGGTKNESGQSVVATSDGGFAVLGYSQSMDGDILNKSNISYDFWLIKYNFNGEQE